MSIQSAVKRGIDGDRDDLVRVLAEHRVLPTVVDRAESGSSLLGRSTPTITLEPQAEATGSIDRQTSAQVANVLDLDSEAACESVREEIRDHPAW